MANKHFRRDKVTRNELIQSLVLYRDAVNVLEEAVELLKNDDDFLAVGFKASLERGIAGTSSFTSELRTSIGMHRVGAPFVPDPVEPARSPRAAKGSAKTTKKKPSRRRG